VGNGLLAHLPGGRVPQVGRSDGWPPRLPSAAGQNPAYRPAHRHLSVFSFGDTQFYGSIPGLGPHPAGSGLPNSLNAPIVGMVPSFDDGGYFMVGADGGVFGFGDARFAGSCPGIVGGCAGAAVAVMPDHSGNGYWVVTKAESVYAFGDAPYLGAPSRGR
jgi:hypothetical protein